MQFTKRLNDGFVNETDLYEKILANPTLRPQMEAILQTDCGYELEPTFLGFSRTYELLADLIPLHYTVIDLGCNCAFQAYYFQRHKKYIGIDSSVPITSRLETGNSIHFQMNLLDFKPEDSPNFAICNYVPGHENIRRDMADKYDSMYVFYPKHV